MNFNADGDKILTGSFDGTAIVLNEISRSGIRNQDNPFIYFRVILEKYQLLSSSLEVICAERPQSIKLADYGMLEQANACQCSEDILTKSWTSTSTQSELILLLRVSI